MLQFCALASALCLLSGSRTCIWVSSSCCINNKTDYHNMSKRIRLTQNIELVRKYIKKILFQFKCIPLLYLINVLFACLPHSVCLYFALMERQGRMLLIASAMVPLNGTPCPFDETFSYAKYTQNGAVHKKHFDWPFQHRFARAHFLDAPAKWSPHKHCISIEQHYYH